MNARAALDRLMATNQAIAFDDTQRSPNTFLVRYQGVEDGGYRAERMTGGELSIRVQTSGVPAVGAIGMATQSGGVALAWF